MIAGVGCDIIEIPRIAAAIEKPAFLERCFTDAEREYITSHGASSAAAAFAAKEAVSKALGTGISGFGMRDIEILHELNGKPYAVLHGGAAALAEKIGARVSISLSHSREYAVAYAVLDAG